MPVKCVPSVNLELFVLDFWATFLIFFSFNFCVVASCLGVISHTFCCSTAFGSVSGDFGVGDVTTVADDEADGGGEGILLKSNKENPTFFLGDDVGVVNFGDESSGEEELFEISFGVTGSIFGDDVGEENSGVRGVEETTKFELFSSIETLRSDLSDSSMLESPTAKNFNPSSTKFRKTNKLSQKLRDNLIFKGDDDAEDDDGGSSGFIIGKLQTPGFNDIFTGDFGHAGKSESIFSILKIKKNLKK